MTSKIEWCDETVNPFTGCRRGCEYCYARRMAKRLVGMGVDVYHRVNEAREDPFHPSFHNDVLAHVRTKLMCARKPRRVFVGSMGDMCFEGDMDYYSTFAQARGVITTYAVQHEMAKLCHATPQHTFLFLTKRPHLLYAKVDWPPNAHLGVSITSDADLWRVKALAAHPLFNHGRGEMNSPMPWVSVEPLLGPVDPTGLAGMDWTVIGMETGPGGRSVPLARFEGAHVIVDWCKQAGVPCFAKDSIRRHDLEGVWPTEIPGRIE